MASKVVFKVKPQPKSLKVTGPQGSTTYRFRTTPTESDMTNAILEYAEAGGYGKVIIQPMNAGPQEDHFWFVVSR